MKNFFAIIGIIFLILAVAAVGVLGYYSKGFKDWSFIQGDTQPNQSDPTTPGGSTTPGGTTPGGTTDPGGSTTPGGSPDLSDEHNHTYQWGEKQQSFRGLPHRAAYNNIPEGFEDYYILDEFHFTESSEQFVFYYGIMSTHTDTSYFLSPDAVVLASCGLDKDADDFLEIDVPLSYSLHLIGFKIKGYDSGIYPIAEIKYSVCICTGCGELKNSSDDNTNPGETTTPGASSECNHQYQWVLSQINGMKPVSVHTKAQNDMPEALAECLIAYEYSFVENSNTYTFDIGMDTVESPNFYFYQNGVALALGKYAAGIDQSGFLKFEFQLSDDLKVLGFKILPKEGFTICIDLKYSVFICLNCGEFKDVSGESTKLGGDLLDPVTDEISGCSA